MMYDTRQTLPKGVTHVLPEGAQDTYLAAFNRALKEYNVPRDRRMDEFDARVVSAHMIAWAAVKQRYERGQRGAWRVRRA